MRTSVILLFAILVGTSAACHRYGAVPAATIAAPADVRVSFAPPRELRVHGDGEEARTAEVAELHGRVIARRADSADVRIETLVGTDGRRLAGARGALVTIPLEGELRARRFDGGQTALGALGVVGVVGVLLFIACGEFCR